RRRPTRFSRDWSSDVCSSDLEIPALEPLLESIPRMEGALVTADAMQCQQQACAYITQERGADYLIGLKGNQSGILERAQIKLPQIGRASSRERLTRTATPARS